MIERFPAPKSPELPEFSGTESRLIRALKERGPEDEETKKILNAWLDAGEANVKAADKPSANIAFSLKQAELYAAAGFVEGARQNAEAAMEEAANCGEPDLWEATKSILDKMERQV